MMSIRKLEFEIPEAVSSYLQMDDVVIKSRLLHFTSCRLSQQRSYFIWKGCRDCRNR